MKRSSHVRINEFRRETYERLYPGIGGHRRLTVVQRIDVPPGDYMAPLVGVEWNDNSTAWLYEKDTIDA